MTDTDPPPPPSPSGARRSYCYRCGNVASILKLDENLQQEYITFDAAPQEAKGIPAKRPLPEYCASSSRARGRLCLRSFLSRRKDMG